jgi:hypothetical protein
MLGICHEVFLSRQLALPIGFRGLLHPPFPEMPGQRDTEATGDGLTALLGKIVAPSVPPRKGKNVGKEKGVRKKKRKKKGSGLVRFLFH